MPEIVNVQFVNQARAMVRVEYDDGTDKFVNAKHKFLPTMAGNPIQDWVNAGNQIQEPDPDLAGDAALEQIDQAGPVMVALLQVMADREGITIEQLKADIAAKMGQ